MKERREREHLVREEAEEGRAIDAAGGVQLEHSKLDRFLLFLQRRSWKDVRSMEETVGEAGERSDVTCGVTRLSLSLALSCLISFSPSLPYSLLECERFQSLPLLNL